MTKLTALLAMFLSATAWAATSAVIFGPNNTAQTIPPVLSLGGSAYIRFGTANPTSTAALGSTGSLYLRTGASGGAIYVKTDTGSSTNWTPLGSTASPTFTGTVTIPSPFTLGSTSVTTSGTQLNYLTSATGTTGTASTNLVYSASPVFTGVITWANGSSTAPSTAFSSSATTGFYRDSGSIGTSIGGIQGPTFQAVTNHSRIKMYSDTKDALNLIYANATDGGVTVSGSSGGTSGGNIRLYGTTATKASIVEIYTGTTLAQSVSAAGLVAFPTVTTGTNADFVCMDASKNLTLQTSACTISSRRFKENIFNLDHSSGLAEILKMRPVEFNMKTMDHPNADMNYGRTQIGLIAEELNAIDPRLAIYEQDGKTPKSYRQESLIAVLVKGMQEQQAQIRSLKHRIEQLER